MATKAQMKANRNNAKKSTGPRTEQGKTRSATNALKHGLLARDTVLPGEDPADFDSQLSALEADIQPANSLEFELVRQIADAQWRMRRLTRLETGFLAASLAEKRRVTERLYPERLQPGYDGETLLLGSAIIGRTDSLGHLARYDGSPTAARIGFRASRESAPQPALSKINDRAVPVRARAPQAALMEMTKQTQSRRTLMKPTLCNDEPRSADLAVEIRGLCSVPPLTDTISLSGAASLHRTGQPTFPPSERVRPFCGAHS